jgi:asparagine synthase (glutamine-hydrolysing)
VKPFYYSETPDFFLFSNTLNCVRLHPNVSDDLNEAALADFLLFGLNCDTTTTTFRAIRRLPPAHRLTVSADELRTERYWTAPTNGRIRYRHSDDYVEHFQILLQAAVADRMRTDHVGILLSGGLDSGAIAATARELSPKTTDAANLRAYTVVYESLIPDRDGSSARATAEFLGIPIQCIAFDDLHLFDRWDDPERAWPEPVDDPLLAGLFDQFGMIAKDCRVVLSGDGSDNLMHFQMLPYARDLLRRRQWRRAILEFPMYLRMRPSFVPGIRRRIKGVFARDASEAVFPQWLAPDFARRTNLAERWKERNRLSTLPSHPVLPKGHASLDIPQWPHLFEHEDPGVTHCVVEVRNPFMDLRIVEYLLALPPFPWFFEKMLVREAMVGRLPEKVRLRPKTPLEIDPLAARLNHQGTNWLDQVCWDEDLSQYVSTSALLPLARRANAEQTLSCMRAVCLNFWLQSSRRVRYNLHAEASNG